MHKDAESCVKYFARGGGDQSGVEVEQSGGGGGGRVVGWGAGKEWVGAVRGGERQGRGVQGGFESAPESGGLIRVGLGRCGVLPCSFCRRSGLVAILLAPAHHNA